jgi:hypothetical protein
MYSGVVNIFRTHHQPNMPTDKDYLKINNNSRPIRKVEACSLILKEVSDQ